MARGCRMKAGMSSYEQRATEIIRAIQDIRAVDDEHGAAMPQKWRDHLRHQRMVLEIEYMRLRCEPGPLGI